MHKIVYKNLNYCIIEILTSTEFIGEFIVKCIDYILLILNEQRKDFFNQTICCHFLNIRNILD